MARRHSFQHDGYRLVYDEYGAGPRPLVLLPGLLLSRKMHAPLAEALAARGNHVYVLDFLGHGDSDRPRDLARYTMPLLGDQVIALLDHLELDEVVLGGTSLGANVALDVMTRAPERLRGAIIEMPVLDNALLGCAIAFTPLLVYLTFGSPIAKAVARVARLVPRGSHNLVDTGLDSISQEPGPSASVIQGLFFGRVAPPRSERALIETPSLVIGHPRDPVHPFSDADELARELHNARLLDANSILELRLAPERLTNEIARFVEDCWRPATAARRRSGARAASRTGKRRASA
ncbi:MAG: alpha/beta fold hydrolase [Thermoleophilaceae bacterium]